MSKSTAPKKTSHQDSADDLVETPPTLVETPQVPVVAESIPAPQATVAVPVETPVIIETPFGRSTALVTEAMLQPPGGVLEHQVFEGQCTLAVQRMACRMYLGFQENDKAKSAIVPWLDLTVQERSNWCAATIAALPQLNAS